MPLLLLLWGGAQRAFFSIIEFCSKPPGSWIAAALGLVLGAWLVHHHGYKQGISACEVEHAEAAAQERARQQTVFIDTDKRSVDRTTKSETANTQNKVIVRVIHDKAAAMPEANDVCIDAVLADSVRALK